MIQSGDDQRYRIRRNFLAALAAIAALSETRSRRAFLVFLSVRDSIANTEFQSQTDFFS
jgi:hypothetical protein